MNQYGFEKGRVPASYSPTSWEDKKERTSRDYGEPQSSNGPEKWAEFENLERDITYLKQFSCETI